jgi:hypothetical protein
MDLATAVIFSYSTTLGLHFTIYIYSEIKKFVIEKYYG